MSYSPTIGRFLERDPIEYDDGANVYQYVGGNPIARTDPLGLYSIGWIGGGFKTFPSSHKTFPGFWGGLGISDANDGVLSKYSYRYDIETQNPPANEIGGGEGFFYDPIDGKTPWEGVEPLEENQKAIILTAAGYTSQAFQWPVTEHMNAHGRLIKESTLPACSKGTYRIRWDIQDGVASRPSGNWSWDRQRPPNGYDFPIVKDPPAGTHGTGDDYNHKPFASRLEQEDSFKPTAFVEVIISWNFFDGKSDLNVKIRSNMSIGSLPTRLGRKNEEAQYPVGTKKWQ
jgi:uncharacterized protein RhaS with RHS repeats